MKITKRARMAAFGALIACPLYGGALTAQQAAAQPAPQQTAPKHHSKLKGAIVGAAAGHMLGGHAKAGAVAGAVVQHERNKHARKYR